MLFQLFPIIITSIIAVCDLICKYNILNALQYCVKFVKLSLRPSTLLDPLIFIDKGPVSIHINLNTS